MKILALEPHRKPQIVDIDGSLKSMQEIVKGSIEAIFPFDDPVALICNEEGKFDGSKACLMMADEAGAVKDIIFGTVFICGLGEEDFVSIPDDLIEKYTHFLNTWRYA